MEEVKKQLDGVVDRWCPVKTHEDFTVRMVRALLNLDAYEADCKLVLAGKPPLRTDYPIPFPQRT